MRSDGYRPDEADLGQLAAAIEPGSAAAEAEFEREKARVLNG
jgi:hypothetical protein